MNTCDIFLIGFRGFPNIQGGIETHVEHLAPRLANAGLKVTACTRSPYVSSAAGRRWNGVNMLRIWTVQQKFLETIIHSVLCAIIAGFHRPKLVHVHGIGPALVTPLLRLLGLRVVVTHHGEDYNREKWGWPARTILRAGEMSGMFFASKVIAISRTIQDTIHTKYGIRCEVIPNGVEIPELPTKTNHIDTLGLDAGKYVLTVGRIVPEKRQHDILLAFKKASPREWKLVIVGQVDHASSYADHLVSEARRNSNVVIAGFQTGEALSQLYAHAGAFVLASSHEGLPIALLEAMSYGLPTLVSDIPPNSELITDTERKFRVGDVDVLASKMSQITTVSLDAKLRESTRRAITANYDWDDISDRTHDVYKEVLTSSRSLKSGHAASPKQQLSDRAPM